MTLLIIFFICGLALLGTLAAKTPKWAGWMAIDLFYYPLGGAGVILLSLSTQHEATLNGSPVSPCACERRSVDY